MAKTIKSCLEAISECADCAIRMRDIVENTWIDTEIRYRAVVMEEAHLELIERYIQRVRRLQEEMVAIKK